MRILLSFGILAALFASVPSAWAQQEQQKDPTKEFFWYQCYICHVANDPYEPCTPERSRPNLGLEAGPRDPVAMTRKDPAEALFMRVQNAHGPDLCGVFGQPAGRRAKSGYRHSPNFLELAPKVVWTEENLDKYLTDTRAFIPGAWMFVKLEDADLRHRIIEFLKTYK
jgi:cytochrome c2